MRSAKNVVLKIFGLASRSGLMDVNLKFKGCITDGTFPKVSGKEESFKRIS